MKEIRELENIISSNYYILKKVLGTDPKNIVKDLSETFEYHRYSEKEKKEVISFIIDNLKYLIDNYNKENRKSSVKEYGTLSSILLCLPMISTHFRISPKFDESSKDLIKKVLEERGISAKFLKLGKNKWALFSSYKHLKDIREVLKEEGFKNIKVKSPLYFDFILIPSLLLYPPSNAYFALEKSFDALEKIISTLTGKDNIFPKDTFGLLDIKYNKSLIYLADDSFKKSMWRVFKDLSGIFGTYSFSVDSGSYKVFFRVQNLPSDPYFNTNSVKTLSLQIISNSEKGIKSLENIIDNYFKEKQLNYKKFNVKIFDNKIMISYIFENPDPSILHDCLSILKKINPQFANVIETKYLKKLEDIIYDNYKVDLHNVEILTFGEFFKKYKSSERVELPLAGTYYPYYDVEIKDGKVIEEQKISYLNIEGSLTSVIPKEVFKNDEEFKKALSSIHDSLDALIFSAELTCKMIDYNYELSDTIENYKKILKEVDYNESNLNNATKEILKRYEKIIEKEYWTSLSNITLRGKGVCQHYALLTRAIFGDICAYKGFNDLYVNYVCSKTLSHAWLVVAFKDKNGKIYMSFVDPTFGDIYGRHVADALLETLLTTYLLQGLGDIAYILRNPSQIDEIIEARILDAVDNLHAVGEIKFDEYKLLRNIAYHLYYSIMLPYAETWDITQQNYNISMKEVGKFCINAIKDLINEKIVLPLKLSKIKYIDPLRYLIKRRYVA